ncbi:hypothetical protein V6Z11_D11G325700 [Gossypium hirsutum]|uniref:Zinc transporter ZTP29 n=3 Tax=Gossypium TaxID=3633 RepID=A0ABM3B138_GOSHI|nr:zinc transporter ZTP29 [Gossypium raimondii]XP_012434419.1 zinc transporter ZTP29 [Gossypium raimondii]XP_040960757.1 zinc transporter ZTP29-like [Gossypium hirsutum]XP_040960758.1 zinc transporter ZTP29-like [Gossypium hirsutum]KJB45616.1 hypothetical protein B456_007G316100 [Gossypium raimondii]
MVTFRELMMWRTTFRFVPEQLKSRAYLFPSSLSPEILEGLLGSVGGVMAFLTLHEMLPLVFDYSGQKQAVKAVFFGMAFMSASLYFLELSLPKDMSL